MQLNGEEFFADNFFVKKLGEAEFLVATTHGFWDVLNESELAMLRRGDFESNPIFFSRLRQKNILITADNIRGIAKKLKNDYSYLFEYPKTHSVSLEGITDEKIVSIMQFIASAPEREMTVRFLDHPKSFNQMHFAFLFVKNYTNKNVHFRALLSDANERKASVLKENNVVAEIAVDKEKMQDRFILDMLERLKKHDVEREVLLQADEAWLGNENKLLEFLEKYGITKFRLERGTMDAQRFFELWKNVFSAVMERRKAVAELVELSTIDALHAIFKKQPAMPCSCGIGEWAYSSGGDIYPSPKVFGNEMFRIGSVYNTKPEDILFHPTNISFRSLNRYTLHAFQQSSFAPFISLCPVESYLESGNVIPSARNAAFVVQEKMLEQLFSLLADEENKIMLEKLLD